MTASRLGGKELSTTQWVDVQANWNGADVTAANGGQFLAPIEWVGTVGLVNWQFYLPTVTGTSLIMKLTAPDLSPLPDQWLGYIGNRVTLYGALLAAGGVISATMTVTSSTVLCLRGMLTAARLN